MRRTSFSGLAIAACLAVAAPVSAQSPVVRSVGFEEAVRQAIERSPTISLARVNISEAGAFVQQAEIATRPSVVASFNNFTLDGQRGFSGGVTQPRNQSAFGVSALAPLLVVPQWSAATQARDQVTVATDNAVETRRQVAVAAAHAYLLVIAAQRQVDVDLRALENARAHLDYADRRLEGGVGSRLNQLRAAQAVSDNEARLENMRHLLRRAQETLGVQLAENGPVDAAAVPEFEAPGPGSFDEWLASRPDVRAQATTIRAAERVVRDTWKEWLPTAAVAFDPSWVRPSGLFQPSGTWRLTFSVSQRVFDTSVRANSAMRRVALERTEVTLSAIEIQARSEIRVAQDSVESFDRALASARLAAEQANDVLRISTAAFEVGATTNIEVIDAQRSARDAETLAALADDALRRARLDLLAAIGRFPQ